MTIGSHLLPGRELSVDEQESCAVDGMTPTRVLHPQDSEDAARGLRQCTDAGAAVVVIGGGTQLRLGAPPRRYDVAFLTTRLDSLLEYEPADMTCRVQAGLPVQRLQEELGKQGQWLPLDPPHPERATVGGMVATNASGWGTARYGTVRDWVIGITVAYPTGTVARAGGRVVKNVAGYDLMKLHTGALGTLGMITEVNLKVQARPERVVSVGARFERPADAVACGLELSRHYLQPAVLLALDRHAMAACGWMADANALLAMRLQGHPAEVEASGEVVTGAVRSNQGRLLGGEPPPGFWEAVRDWPAPQEATAIVLRGAVPRTGLTTLLQAAGPDDAFVAQPATGIAVFRPLGADPAPLLDRLRHVAGPDGQVVVASAPPALKHGLDVWGDPPPGFPLMRALKQALDPQATLNPGRFVGGL